MGAYVCARAPGGSWKFSMVTFRRSGIPMVILVDMCEGVWVPRVSLQMLRVSLLGSWVAPVGAYVGARVPGGS